MNLKSKKILFFGNEKLATGTRTNLKIIHSLLNLNYQICGVILPDLNKTKSNLEIIPFAKKHNIDLIAYSNKTKILEIAKTNNIHTAILVSFGKIISQEILNIFSNGIINIHPSLLPLHRGPTPVESFILGNESTTGTSIIKLTKEMDAGPIYVQRELENIDKFIRKQKLCDDLDNLSAELVQDNFDNIYFQKLDPVSQKGTPSYDNLIDKNKSFLDFINFDAYYLEKLIRAYELWPRTKLNLNNTSYIITKSHVIKGSDKPGTIYLKNNSFGIFTKKDILIFDKILPAGRKEMSVSDFLRGYRNKIISTSFL